MHESTRQSALADLHGLPGHLLWRAAARVNIELDRILPSGTDIHAYGALLALADGEPQSQRSLAGVIGVSCTTLTSVAGSLQRDALVERVRNPADRRSYSLTRTSAGRSAVRRWAPHVDRLEEHLTRAVSAKDAVRLREVLVRIIGDQLHENTPAALRNSTGFLVIRAHQRAHREFTAALQPLGIEPRDFGTMRALRVVGPATQNEVGALLEVSAATVVHFVDHLEENGLVTRQPDPVDRRVHRLFLTVDAVRVVEEATVISERVLDDRLGGPRGGDRTDLLRLLGLLLRGGSSS